MCNIIVIMIMVMINITIITNINICFHVSSLVSFCFQNMNGQLRLLNIACAAKAKPRTVTLTRATRDEILSFSILGGVETGIFITKVDHASKAHEVGLKRGDQVCISSISRATGYHHWHSKPLIWRNTLAPLIHFGFDTLTSMTVVNVCVCVCVHHLLFYNCLEL